MSVYKLFVQPLEPGPVTQCRVGVSVPDCTANATSAHDGKEVVVWW